MSRSRAMVITMNPERPAMPLFPLYPLLIRATHALFFLPENDYWWLLTGIVLFNIALLVALGYFRSILAIDFDQETGISHHYLSPDLSDYFLFFLRLQ